MTENLEELADAEEQRGPSDEELNTVSRLAERQREQEEIVAQKERELKEAKRELRHTREVDLPEAMQQAGLSEAALADGSKIKVEEGVDAHVSKDRQAEAFKWLEDNGFGDIIKCEAKVDIGRDEQLRQVVVDALESAGVEPDVARSVHPQTLKAFVRERVNRGDIMPPEDTFGIFHYRKAKVTSK